VNLLTAGDSAASAQQRKRILVVDDDRLRLYVNSVILRLERYDVLACLNPGIATRLLRVERIDVAILDIECRK
jgi:CheY-like chemotaxis protein